MPDEESWQTEESIGPAQVDLGVTQPDVYRLSIDLERVGPNAFGYLEAGAEASDLNAWVDTQGLPLLCGRCGGQRDDAGAEAPWDL